MSAEEVTTIFEEHLDPVAEELSIFERLKKDGAINKAALPIVVSIGVIRLLISVKDDIKNATTRNTVETFIKVAAGLGGRFAGRRGGSAVGAWIQPQNGASIGAIVGSILGAILGGKVAGCTVKTIGNLLNYGIVAKECVTCKAHFKILIYKGEKEQNTCEYCEGTEVIDDIIDH